MNSKIYVKFYEEKPNGLLEEGLGSDSVYFLDGRNRLETMIKDSIDRIYALKAVKNYVGYEIRKGNFWDYKVVFTSSKIKLEKEQSK